MRCLNAMMSDEVYRVLRTPDRPGPGEIVGRRQRTKGLLRDRDKQLELFRPIEVIGRIPNVDPKE